MDMHRAVEWTRTPNPQNWIQWPSNPVASIDNSPNGNGSRGLAIDRAKSSRKAGLCSMSSRSRGSLRQVSRHAGKHLPNAMSKRGDPFRRICRVKSAQTRPRSFRTKPSHA